MEVSGEMFNPANSLWEEPTEQQSRDREIEFAQEGGKLLGQHEQSTTRHPNLEGCPDW